MKRINVWITPVVALSVVAIAFGCASKATADPSSDVSSYTTSSETDINIVKKQYNISYKCPDDTTWGSDIKVYTTVDADLQWIGKYGDCDLTALHKAILKTAFSDSCVTSKTDLDSAVKKYLSTPVMNEDVKAIPFKGEAPASADGIMTLSKSVQGRIQKLGGDKYDANVLVYRISFSDYQGGAHGNYGYAYINFDPSTSSVITMDKIFKSGSKPQLLKLIKKQLCEDNHVHSLAGLDDLGFFPDQIKVAEQFFVDTEGICFSYDPYDIACYATGAVSVTVPYYDLRDTLTDYAKKLFGMD